MKRKYLIALLILSAAAVAAVYLSKPLAPSEVVVSDALQRVLPVGPSSGEPEITPAPAVQPPTKPEVKPAPQEVPPPTRTIPAKVMLDVPFAVQAPFGNWALPYKEACEEASVIMVDRFYQHQENLDQQEIKNAIDGMAAWGEAHFDGKIDTNAPTTARYFTEYLGYASGRVVVVNDPTIEDIKAVLAAGYPVIVPAAGRDLGNPYFTAPGPQYHMLVIIGYDEDEFITNDPGTRRGEQYRYHQRVLYDAIHDLTPDLARIREGRKTMIVVKP
ncbi:MAG: C39 family peptidase [Parcubacteria group bacterium]|nr:C39 family peptidase [Parcubacteria group bacterium]